MAQVVPTLVNISLPLLFPRRDPLSPPWLKPKNGEDQVREASDPERNQTSAASTTARTHSWSTLSKTAGVHRSCTRRHVAKKRREPRIVIFAFSVAILSRIFIECSFFFLYFLVFLPLPQEKMTAYRMRCQRCAHIANRVVPLLLWSIFPPSPASFYQSNATASPGSCISNFALTV